MNHDPRTWIHYGYTKVEWIHCVSRPKPDTHGYTPDTHWIHRGGGVSKPSSELANHLTRLRKDVRKLRYYRISSTTVQVGYRARLYEYFSITAPCPPTKQSGRRQTARHAPSDEPEPNSSFSCLSQHSLKMCIQCILVYPYVCIWCIQPWFGYTGYTSTF